MFLTLAWRNLWRNKRRTAITLASIFFAVILATLMMSIKEGTYDNMIKTAAGDFNGYAQVHLDGYWEERTLDFAFEPNDSLLDEVKKYKSVKALLPRIESFVLVATDSITKGSLVFGIDHLKENEASNLEERVIEGTYFEHGKASALIGEGLSEYLKIGVGDTIVLLGSGYHGISAAGKYAVGGIVKFGSPELSKQVIFLPLESAQHLFGAYNLINNLAIKTADSDAGVKLVKNLKNDLSKDFEVMDWKELNPDLVNMIKTDRVEGYVFMFILYMVISFGIFGTVLMMLAERRHEFGVLIAVGMKRIKLGLVVLYEVIIISVFGALLGILGAIPVCYYFIAFPIEYGDEVAKMAEDYGMEPVLKASLDPSIFAQQAIVIAIIGIIIGLYPLFKISNADAVKEMRA